MDIVDVKGLPKEIAQQIQQLVDLPKGGEIKRRENIEEEKEEARRKFFEMVDEIHEYNKDVDPEILEKEIEEAVQAVKKQELEEMTSKV